MRPIKVAVLGAVGWMGKVHTMSYQDMPYIFGDAKGRADIVWVESCRVVYDQDVELRPGVS